MKKAWVLAGLAGAAVLTLSACGPAPSSEDAGSVDAGGTRDSGSVQDSGQPDSGFVDAGTVDAGGTDAGTADSGTADAGSGLDAGSGDAGSLTVPDAPTAVSADAGIRSAWVAWTAPVNTGGTALIGYAVTPWIGSNPLSTVAVGNVTSTQVTGLDNATTYTFTVAAQNSVGQGPDSAPSNAITTPDVPAAPVITAQSPVTEGVDGWTASTPAVSGQSYSWTVNGGTLTNPSGSAGDLVGSVNQITYIPIVSGQVTIDCVATDAVGSSVAGSASANVVPPPSIGSFTASASTITLGDSTMLNPVFQNGTGAIDNGIGAAASGTPVSVSPTSTTVYTLTVTNPAGTSVTATVTVTVVAPPSITSFAPAAGSITQGNSTTLTAVFQGGTGTIDNGVGAIASGSPVTVSPTVTTTYTLTVVNAAGTAAQAQATVTVFPAPSITSFTAGKSPITSGTSTTLTAVFQNGTGTIDNGIGAVASGTPVSVSPTSTTTYTLTVTNPAGSSVASTLTINVVPPPSITSFAPAAGSITQGNSTTLTAVFQGGTGTVDNGVGAVASNSPVTVSPTATTTYTLTVVNAAGTSVQAQATVTVVPAPSITSFAAGSTTITNGTSTTLTAVFQNGSGSIDNGVGSVTSGSAVSVSPTANTTYTLTVTNSLGATVQAQVTINVVAPPSITSFTASPTTIDSSKSSQLTAVFQNGTGSVNNGVGNVTSGTPVTVRPTTTTTYTLTVTNAAGTAVTATTTVTVVPLPVIYSFIANPWTITQGNASQVTAQFSGGTGTVNNGVGTVTSGTPFSVSPSATTTYTLTVTNSVGSTATQTATVTVVPPPSIQSFVAAQTLITQGTSTTLTATFQNGTGTIDNGVGAVTSGTAVTVTPAATTTYTLTVTNAGGTSVTATVTVTVVPPPTITSFSASPATITQGTSSSLTAVFSNGTGSVNNGVGAVTSGTAVSVSPAATTTYTLTVTNAAGATKTATTTVTVVPPPVQPTITAPAQANAGAQGLTASVTAHAGMTYQWTVTGGTITSAGGSAGVTGGGLNTITFNVSAPGGGSVSLSCVEINAANTQSTPGTASVKVLVGPPSVARTTILAKPISAPNDGTTPIQLTVTVRDQGGDLLANQAVTLSTNGSAIILTPASGTSNASGVFTANMTSTVIQGVTVTAHVGTLAVSTQVQFTAPACAGLMIFPNPPVIDEGFFYISHPGLAAGDFNHDGKLDVAVAGTNGLDVDYGSGKGDFSSGHWYQMFNYTNGVVTADFNGDGFPDLAATTQSNQVEAILGLADGGFSGSTTTNVGASPKGLAAADFNGDGKPDLAVANNGGNTVSVLLGNGAGGFSLAYTPPVGIRPVALAAGDFDGDGKKDLAVTNAGSASVSILLSNGDGTFRGGTALSAPAPQAVAVGDLNGDGKLDLVVSGYGVKSTDPGLSVFLGKGDGTFQPAVGYLIGNNIAAVALVDWNGDGKLDVGVTRYVSGDLVSALLGNGDGTLQPPMAGGDSAYDSLGLVVGDFNGDGKLDAATCGGGAVRDAVTLGNGDGTFHQMIRDTAGSYAFGLAAADINRDGVLDLVTPNNGTNTVSVVLSPASGSPGRTDYVATSSTSINPYQVAAGDLNGDGWPDVVVTTSSSSASVSVLLGAGDGGLLPYTSYPGNGATQLVIADLTNDGVPDVAVVGGNNLIDVFPGKGNGTLSPFVGYSVPSPSSLAVGDLNRDGLPDLLVGATGHLSILLAQNGGGFAAHADINYTSSGTGTSVAVADINNDGILDVAVSVNTGPGSGAYANVFLGNGDGTFQPPKYVGYVATYENYSILVADLNNDGKPDLATADAYSDTVMVNFGNGDGTFGTLRTYTVNGPYALVAGDFNGDGRTDLASEGISILPATCVP